MPYLHKHKPAQRASATTVTEVLVHKKMFKLQSMQQGRVWDFLFYQCCRYDFFSAYFSISKSIRFWTFPWRWASHKAVFKIKYIQFLSNSLFYVIPSQVSDTKKPQTVRGAQGWIFCMISWVTSRFLPYIFWKAKWISVWVLPYTHSSPTTISDIIPVKC